MTEIEIRDVNFECEYCGMYNTEIVRLIDVIIDYRERLEKWAFDWHEKTGCIQPDYSIMNPNKLYGEEYLL